ncbi:hypothetical protein K470DRAFT_122508 [Piedraia hortae CBS 480.64]|uniref:Uncharacterized protein n=1 Tax=Piedraia hortae CBS 480.64 TaxID=1314780 RepID=A0A6A7C7C9_9PEZI|nr:hypothetical protein K470DRAFT_122508 [Piedraia hortae CBS 480.64]
MPPQGHPRRSIKTISSHDTWQALWYPWIDTYQGPNNVIRCWDQISPRSNFDGKQSYWGSLAKKFLLRRIGAWEKSSGTTHLRMRSCIGQQLHAWM